ncbi:hypothetical protein ACIA5G_30215 [Amycolatopsis sp. NPDC051758]|uniref:hypothetical protein n=1 Tax=Amycolatopsis sp. NPDC051758 TaxID=3363935 RepID=UPI0037A58006
MTAGRVTLIVTCVLVAGLAGWLALARWDDANKVATAVSALGAVAAVGVAVWAVIRAPKAGRSMAVSDTGRATATSGGKAVTGFSGKADSTTGSVQVERTGDAQASGDGNAVSGVQLD